VEPHVSQKTRDMGHPLPGGGRLTAGSHRAFSPIRNDNDLGFAEFIAGQGLIADL
jgi:hypothetical protein